MDYSLDDPDLDFAGKAAILSRVLKQAQEDKQTQAPAPKMMGNWVFNTGPMGGVAAAVQRGLGQYNEQQADAEQSNLNKEQLRRYDELSRQMNTPGLKKAKAMLPGEGPMPSGAPMPPIDTGETVEIPMDPLEENQRRMGVAMQMSKLPMASGVANTYLQQSASFPEKYAQMKQKAEDKLAEIQLRLQDKTLDRDSKAQLAAMADDTKRFLGTLMANTQMGIAQLRADVAREGKANAPDGKPLTSAETNAIYEPVVLGRELGELGKSFKPDYAGYGAVGDIARKLASTAGSWAPADVQQANNWWADFERLVELPLRNKTFGSALTAPERALWDQARLIKPGSDPKVVADTVKKMSASMTNKAETLGRSAVAGGKSKGAVAALTGNENGSTPTARRVYNRDTGGFD